MRKYPINPFLFATLFPLIIAVFPYLSHAQSFGNSCVSCHTDSSKMKALITKFPELPEEEGEA